MFFTLQQIKQIKAALWYGEMRHNIAARFSCSVPFVNNISHGDRHRNVEWPDGSIGAINKKRLRRVMIVRKQITAEMQDKIDEMVRAALKREDREEEEKASKKSEGEMTQGP